MRTRIQLLTLGLLVVVTAVSCTKPIDDATGAGQGGAAAAKDAPAGAEKLRVAVVTGGHPFDVPNFYRLLRELPGVDAYPQHIEHFASCPDETRDAYDAVVFYGMHRGVPDDEGPKYAGKPKAAVERLVERGQGIVVVHHALLAWEKWDFWNQLIGFDNRNFGFKEGLNLKVEVAGGEHPITAGLETLEIVDEGYILHGKHDGKGEVLLTVDHENAMDEVAWVRQHGKSNVFCLALGHDNQAWGNPGFRQILARGIAWSAGE